MRYARVFVLALFGTLAYGQAVAGFEQAQEQDLERKHALQMQRDREQYALELARIQAQSRAVQPSSKVLLWESGNAFLQVCEASLGRPEQQIAPTGAGTVEMIECGMFLLGLEEGMNLGVQFAEASTRTTSPQPWCMPENGDAVQAARVLVKYIRANPETAHERTALLGLFAFREAFPCPAK